MSDPDFNGTIEVARGRMSDALAASLLRFWASTGALDEAAARRRLPEVVCVLRDAGGRIVGSSSVFPDVVPLVGGRRFWVYRSFLLPSAAGAFDAMVAAAFRTLEAEFDPAGAGPIGLCLLIGDRALLERRPDAEWSDPRLFYAGYLADGRQVRIGYFEGATTTAPGTGYA